MNNFARIEQIVAEVNEASPLPDDFDDLDAFSKRVLTREANERGTSPEDLYALVKADRTFAAESAFDVERAVEAYQRGPR
jgi:hypothetical protein